MASEKQIAANRRNAARSTGPRSPSGKARSRLNALRHGFAARLAVADESGSPNNPDNSNNPGSPNHHDGAGNAASLDILKNPESLCGPDPSLGEGPPAESAMETEALAQRLLRIEAERSRLTFEIETRLFMSEGESVEGLVRELEALERYARRCASALRKK